MRVLKISLGLLCNYACTYCSQRFVHHADQTNPEDVGAFLNSLTDALIEPPERIEFWGGEPLVYWKTLKPLAERLRAMYPKAQFSMITNGSLLDADKNAWIDRLGFSVGLSHDGPGYHARGADPLDDPQKGAAIFDLYARLKPEGRISINAMIHANNPSRAHVQAWLSACIWIREVKLCALFKTKQPFCDCCIFILGCRATILGILKSFGAVHG